MAVFRQHPSLRWAVPVTATVVVLGGGSALGAMTASADTGLPHRSAAQLLVDVQNAHVAGMSGTVVQKSDLGLPDLSALTGAAGGGAGGEGSSELSSLVTGTHTLRVWYAGPDQARMALLGTLGESDVIRNGRDLWVWSSKDRSAVHYRLPAKAGDGVNPAPGDLATSPQEAADRALTAIGPSTRVTTSGTATVAGRSAYELVLKPRSNDSLVSQVRIAIDGRNHVPLRVQVYSTQGTSPAFEVGFSSVSFTAPDAAQFRFNPPPGTKVTNKRLPVPGEQPGVGPTEMPPMGGQHADLRTVGEDWDTVLVGRIPSDGSGPGQQSQLGQLGPMLRQLPKASGDWGSGRVLSSRLLTVVVADDGRIAAGAVTPQAVYAALGR
ncbi:MAG TPA: hypothetical protein VFJ12_11605 [Segeticoccus sp.]|jgi:outer membrane lipoprotein-sorting protein|nr:hypothetical protein [Segeticoccus sp.]